MALQQTKFILTEDRIPRAWYNIAAEEALRRLESQAEGLSEASAGARLQQYGPNAIPERKRRPLLVLVLSQFQDFMILVLLAAALVSGLVGEPEDTIAILVIVLLVRPTGIFRGQSV